MEATERTRMLLVEDDRDFAESVREGLGHHGVEARWVADRQSALEELRTFEPQLALIDLRLGTDSGLEVLATLRRTRPGLACVVMTAFADVDTAIEALRLGADDYLRKPFHLLELVRVVERSLERAALLGRIEQQSAELARARSNAAALTHAVRALVSVATARDEPILRVLDEADRIVFTTPAYARLSGERARPGRHVTELPGGDHPDTLAALDAARAGQGRDLRGEVHDGGRPLKGRSVPLFDAAGDYRGSVAVFTAPTAEGAETEVSPSSYGLSAREREILSIALRGEPVATIADSLGRSPSTVRNHLRSIYRKVGVNSRAQLIRRFAGGSR